MEAALKISHVIAVSQSFDILQLYAAFTDTALHYSQSDNDNDFVSNTLQSNTGWSKNWHILYAL